MPGRLRVVRDQLAADIKAVASELTDYPSIPDEINEPAVIVQPHQPFAHFGRGMGRSSKALYEFDVIFATGRINVESAQERLDDWASPDGSIIPAVWDALAGIKGKVTRVVGQDYGTVRIGGTDYLGFSLHVEAEA